MAKSKAPPPEPPQVDPAKQQVAPENAHRFWRWLHERDGIQIWESQMIGDPGAVLTPYRNEQGQVYEKPDWKHGERGRRLTSPSEVEVVVDREVRRFHVAIRAGSQGLGFKCTDASSRKIKQAVAKAGPGAYYVFDYFTQEAVIMAPESVVSLAEFIAMRPEAPEEA